MTLLDLAALLLRQPAKVLTQLTAQIPLKPLRPILAAKDNMIFAVPSRVR